MQTMRLEILRQAHEFTAHGAGLLGHGAPCEERAGVFVWADVGGSAERLYAHVSVRLRRVWEGWLTWQRGQMVFRVYLIK